MSVSIQVSTSDRVIGVYTVDHKTVVIGRSGSCDIVLPSQFTAVSSRHISLRMDGRGLWVIDGDGTRFSTNGIYIGGVRVATGQWVNVPEEALLSLGSPNRNGSVQIRQLSKSLSRHTNQVSLSASQQTVERATPIPVKLQQENINVAIVRPKRVRSRWKTPGNLLLHVVALGICIIAIPTVMGTTLEAGVVLIALIMLEIYFIPSTISFNRDLPNRFAIFALNLFMGWTLLGWVICLVWSLTAR